MSDPKSLLSDEIVKGFTFEATAGDIPTFRFILTDEYGRTIGGATLSKAHIERLTRVMDLALELTERDL